jgi:hypothetical protein
MRAQLTTLLRSLLVLSIAGLAATACSTATTTVGLRVAQDIGVAEVCRNGRDALQYRFKDVSFKPYIKELRTPSGVNVLLDSPSDHKHHHALMFALRVGETDFWSENPDCGSQVSLGVENVHTRDGKLGRVAAFRDTLSWKQPDGTESLKETRTIRVYSGNGAQPTFLTWESCLSLPAGCAEATLSGDHYFGLGMRFVREMDGAAKFLNADNLAGEVFRGDERLTPSRWCAIQGTVSGKPVTVAMFDYPANPRHPARWFTMAKPFAYLSATLSLHTQPYVLENGAVLDLRYGVALWDGHVTVTEIEPLYQQWVKMEKGGK